VLQQQILSHLASSNSNGYSHYKHYEYNIFKTEKKPNGDACQNLTLTVQSTQFWLKFEPINSHEHISHFPVILHGKLYFSSSELISLECNYYSNLNPIDDNQ
jgi:hypothetical protein